MCASEAVGPARASENGGSDARAKSTQLNSTQGRMRMPSDVAGGERGPPVLPLSGHPQGQGLGPVRLRSRSVVSCLNHPAREAKSLLEGWAGPPPIRQGGSRQRDRECDAPPRIPPMAVRARDAAPPPPCQGLVASHPPPSSRLPRARRTERVVPSSCSCHAIISTWPAQHHCAGRPRREALDCRRRRAIRYRAVRAVRVPTLRNRSCPLPRA